MSSEPAIMNGYLANHSLFFGSNTSEITSNRTNPSGWDGGHVLTPVPGQPWSVLGGRSSGGARSGMSDVENETGLAIAHISHRTILLGY
ncbi:hypothetical protein FWG76_01940 [Candidatus Saccharibacteria bacterium]|nr:hypothetical protein [Candidatus Saccharibacteria bacterium]